MTIIYLLQVLQLLKLLKLLHIILIIAIIAIISESNSDCFLVGWLESVGSRVVYELDYKKPVLYVIPIQSILGTCR